MINILVVEDDKHTRKLLETILKREGYLVLKAEDGIKAMEVLDNHHVDLIILDIMMPNMDGYEFAQELRDADCMIPILMATAKQLPEDKKRGFIVGTDDYMTKPIDTEEMLLRIKALLRRSQIASARKLTIGKVILDYDTLTVTREKLMDEIWGMETESSDTTVNVHINRLRKRFDSYPEFEIISVRGLGYKAVKNDE